MNPVSRLFPALGASALLVTTGVFAAPPASTSVTQVFDQTAAQPAPPRLSVPPPAPASQSAAPSAPAAPPFTPPDADLLTAAIGSSASAFKAHHAVEFAVTEGRTSDFYMGAVQGLPAFVIYTHDGDRITGRQLMLSGTRETMNAVFQMMSKDYATPGALTEQMVECRDAGSKTVGWRLESSTVSRSKTDMLSYREDPTNHAIVVDSNAPAGVPGIEFLNKAYSDLLGRSDLASNAFASQWLGYKAAYDDVSRSKGLFGCRISRGGSPGNLPLKFDVALTQTGAQVVNGEVDIPVPEQFGGLNFSSFQAVLSGGKVSGLRFAGNVSRAQFDETLKHTASNLGDPVTLVTTSNGAQTQIVANFRPSQDPRARAIQTILTYRASIGNTASGTLLFDIH
jgi:hypothetical protein